MKIKILISFHWVAIQFPGIRPEADKSYQFPRVVEEPMKRKKHVVCRMCTHRGKLEEFVATKGPTNSIDTR